jgi:hypothetical protein
MIKFLFEEGQRVKVKDSGEVGVVEYASTDRDLNLPFYRVRFDGGTKPIAESELLPASPTD